GGTQEIEQADGGKQHCRQNGSDGERDEGAAENSHSADGADHWRCGRRDGLTLQCPVAVGDRRVAPTASPAALRHRSEPESSQSSSDAQEISREPNRSSAQAGMAYTSGTAASGDRTRNVNVSCTYSRTD